MWPSGLINGIHMLARRTVDDLGDIVFPSYCVSCGCRTARRSIPICETCYRGIERVDLSDRFRLHPGHAEGPEIFSGIALWYYDPDSPVRRLHHTLKYGNRYGLGISLGRVLGAEIQQTGGIDLIIPIPLHRVRHLERGFNQAEAVARGVNETTNIPVDLRVLRRVKLTRSQTSLDRESRVLNLEGAFRVSDSGRLAGKHVLLIDDVITTGATISSAVTALLNGGATACSVAALAMVRPETRATENPQHKPDHRTLRPHQDRSSQE